MPLLVSGYSKFKPRAVLNFAALSYVKRSFMSRESFWKKCDGLMQLSKKRPSLLFHAIARQGVNVVA